MFSFVHLINVLSIDCVLGGVKGRGSQNNHRAYKPMQTCEHILWCSCTLEAGARHYGDWKVVCGLVKFSGENLVWSVNSH